MISIAIVGYGKMGKEIDSIIPGSEFTVAGRFDVDKPIREHLKIIPDAAIEFSTPKSVIDNIEFLSSKKINIVCGTTGWYDKAYEVKEIIERNGTGFIYASNFSVGVNIFFQIVKYASGLIDRFDRYGIRIEETHHTQKLDKPSGTAIRTAEFILESVKRKKTITNDNPNVTDAELNIISKRIENAVGNHKVILESIADTIILEHNAKSRRGFAEGALLAAKFIYGKKGFYKFEDIFNKLT